ncbi:MAG: RNA degradosome polyphosphate kinase [Lachnospiraceae bacterium]|nr:RNA degradosome polyphosphate kinase [Lachnospiraceae bacterium]
MAAKKIKDFRDPAYYTNRELSWIEFDRRILSEARDKQTPLFERLKFLAIVSSNLDEFVMVRVGSLFDMKQAGYDKPDIAGMTPDEQLRAISENVHALCYDQYKALRTEILPELKKCGLEFVKSHETMTPAECKFADEYFRNLVYPVLTPMAVDSSRPFPLILNKSLNIGAMVRKKGGNGELEFATVQVPSVLPRVILLPENHNMRRFILLEEIIERNMKALFLNYDIVCSHPYRITRNGDMSIDEDDAEDLLKEIEKSVKARKRGQVLRLEIEHKADKRLVSFLKKELSITDSEVYNTDGPLDLTALFKVSSLPGFDDLKNPVFTPAPVPELPAGCDIFGQIRKGDILLFHPYQTFEPVVDFVKNAAVDPDVLAIKQTLYRVSGNSPIIAALATAAENGKQVTVLVELKARFDEEHNIVWARMLEKAGCHVIYGLVGLKTHSKITLVVRRENEGIRRYVHLGTGNYNDATARIYTDVGLLTCREEIGEDATAVFNMLSGYSEPKAWNSLVVAPLWLKDRFLYLIGREEQLARNGKEGRIIAKMNSLSDPDIIEALYKASAAGVHIDLIVRGICCLKTGIKGVSENIKVRSITGNFLEHARIFWFKNDENSEVYCGSADWMPRNLDKRVEIVFPVTDETLKARLKHILDTELEDNRRANILQPLGCNYVKEGMNRKKAVDSQLIAISEAVEAARKTAPKKSTESRVFTPKSKPAK